MKTFWFALIISLNFLTSFAFAQESPKLKVVATTSIIGDWLKNVAGDLVDLTILVGPDGDAHTFEPSPKEMMVLSSAQLIFENGFGLEPWMDKLYLSCASKARRVSLARLVVKQPLSIESHDHEDIDPHVWHNVRYAIGMVKQIGRFLELADGMNDRTYRTNADRYAKELEDLDQWVINRVAVIPNVQRKIVTNHNSLGYFAERYQFQVVGAAFDSVSTEAADSSAKKMAQLIYKIRQAGVKAVFTENIHNARLISSLAKEAQVKLAPELYTDALGPTGSPVDRYIELIKYNTQTIVSMLKGDSD